MQVLGAVHLHAPADASQSRWLPVVTKIVTRLRPELRQDILQERFILSLSRLEPAFDVRLLLGDGSEIRGQFCSGTDDVDESRGNRTARHRIELGLFRVLRHQHATMLLEGFHARGAVGAASGKHDPEAVAVRFGEREQEVVDRRAPTARLIKRLERKLIIPHQQSLAGRDDVYMVLLEARRPCHLSDGHLGRILEHVRQLAFVLRVDVHDDDKRNSRRCRQRTKKLLQRLQAAGRCAKPCHHRAPIRDALLPLTLLRGCALLLEIRHDGKSGP